ncbi:short chain dehydrogenase [Neisseria gonorrhoeae]|uniref:Short chain dehydrogenase n=1 Tax=Neisseria gonorrhoeae TaxID=485 RepID=A0A378VYG6_NEIGO|nr:short chain dehydrogenase [Neisseria gonorrhoeae]
MSAEEKEFERFAATIAEATQGKLDGIVHCAGYFTPSRRWISKPSPNGSTNTASTPSPRWG